MVGLRTFDLLVCVQAVVSMVIVCSFCLINALMWFFVRFNSPTYIRPPFNPVHPGTVPEEVGHD